jgi:adenine-specific DNA-methyltransferase
LLSEIEKTRLELSKCIDPKKKSKLGQFFTPIRIAQFMANLFTRTNHVNFHILDAGAGLGILSTAFVERWLNNNSNIISTNIDVFEVDNTLLPDLTQTLETYKKQYNLEICIRNNDFIESAVDSISGNLFVKPLPRYTHAILNPPYRKIKSDSKHRKYLRKVGIETVNLYSAFVALSLELLENKGQLVAIIPRSFCNGPYYHQFRKYIINKSAIKHIHLFKSRNKAFKDDQVLQENVIIKLERGGSQNDVKISTSTDDTFKNLQEFTLPFKEILSSDEQNFIHIPISPHNNYNQILKSIRYSLNEIGIMVSTGPVVDFRVKEHLCKNYEVGTVPLLYPGHFNDQVLSWPKIGFKKPNAIKINEKTNKWLFPNGFYCVVRRFSSKEEKRRITAHIVKPENFPDAEMLGFENHLNIFHSSKKGLLKSLAYGLNTFLNMADVDENFRRFSGHTQVNANDLRSIKYPSRESLINLGEWVIQNGKPNNETIYKQLKSFDK